MEVAHSVKAEVKKNVKQAYKSKVLLLEDNRVNIKIVTKTLENFVLDYIVAENGEIGIEMAVAEEFDIVLMDIQMPVMEGETATKELIKGR